MAALLRYETAPCARGAPPARWPARASIVPSEERATLVMFLHPRCPCSRASLGELSVLLASCTRRVDAHILLVTPAHAGPDWTGGELEAWARAIPGVHVHLDASGHDAGLFGAATSGNVELYGPDGVRWFSGGITASRGHHGDNAGREAIEALLTGRAIAGAAPASTPVFGCKLAGPCLPARQGAP